MLKSIKAQALRFKGIVSNKLTLKSIPSFTGMIARNGGRPLITWFDKLGRVVVGTSRVWILSYKAFAFKMHKLYKRGGLKYVVIYLKACSVLLQQSVGGQRLLATQSLGCAVSRTKSGLPRIIPSAHRQRILARERDVLRVWLSLFSLYRVLEIPGKLKLETITKPGVAISNSTWSEVHEFLVDFATMIRVFAPNSVLVKALDCDDLGDFLKQNFRAKPFMIAKSSPSNEKGWTEFLPDGTKMSVGYQSTSPESIINAALLFRTDKVMGEVLVKLCTWTGNQWMLNRMESWSKAFIVAGHRVISDSVATDTVNGAVDPKINLHSLSLGKLGLKEEPAGKVRVFAMVDAWTQWLLRPLHDQLFKVLSCIPQDGTFDQLKPVKSLIKEIDDRNITKVFSYDLSAATDRLPLTLQVRILGKFLGIDYARAWGDFLTLRGYRLHSKEYKVKGTFYYAVGQPMGALSSWAMLALTHHFIVQWSAWRVARRENRGVSWFTLYAVLGDDIVIADEAVAKEYLVLMELLGVDINQAKSLVSNKRTMEFAKRFFIPEDASLIPFKELIAATRNAGVMAEFGKKYNLSIPDYLHILGFGYKAKGNLHAPLLAMNLRVRKFLVYILSPFVSHEFSVQRWFSMLSLVKEQDQGHWDRVYQGFKDYSVARLNDMLSSMDERLSEIKALITVKRDREYYGVVKPKVGERALPHYPVGSAEARDQVFSRYYVNRLLGISDGVGKEMIPQHIIDDIAETVFREAYYDVLVEVREIRAKIEAFAESPITEDPFGDIEGIWKSVMELEDQLAQFPSSVGLIFRPSEKAPRAPLGKVYKLWQRFNHLLGSKDSKGS